MLLPNQILDGRYRIINTLGGGAFGQTYLAEDMNLLTQCVVKHLKPLATDPESLKIAARLFDTEAQILHKLGSHEQIPQLFAYFENNSQFYLVQEFIEGHTLDKEIILGRKFSEWDVIRLLYHILTVLSFVHKNRVIHRDIKPENLMRCKRDGKLFLIDFGAVKEISNTQINNVYGEKKGTIVIGTPGYMPIEQIAGNPCFASDLYAVGMLGVQAVTGMSPEQLKINSKNDNTNWHNQTNINPRLKILLSFLDKLIASDSDQRYPSAIEALDMVKKIATDYQNLVKSGLIQGAIKNPTNKPDLSESQNKTVIQKEPISKIPVAESRLNKNIPIDSPSHEGKIEGFKNLGNKLEVVNLALKEIAILIGEQKQEPFVLKADEKILPGLGLKNEANILTIRARDIQQGIFKLIVLGEFKHGKSTLLNAMLGSKKLPAKTTPATAVITMLVYGEENEVTIYEVDKKSPRRVTWESFIREFQLGIEDRETLSSAGKKFIDRFKNIEFAQIECQYPLCRSGVKLIDSPGLAEHISRTKVTTDFLKQSQAVIFLLNATQPLSQEEREFIENNFRHGNVDHVFFVINRINLVDDEDEVEDVKEYFQNYLNAYFLDNQGKVDRHICERRIFFVNAKGALDARLETPVNQQQLESSGLLALEKELEQFLTSNQRLRAALTSTLDLLIVIISQAYFKMIQEQKTMEEPLIELEKRREEVERRLHILQLKENNIRRTINSYSKQISERLCVNLKDYILESKQQWQFDYVDFVCLDSLNFANLALSLFDSSSKELIAKELNEGIEKYVSHLFESWSEKMPTVVKSEFDELIEQLESEFKYFSQEIAIIENFFVTGKNIDKLDIAENKESKMLQLLISLILGDFSQMPGTVMGDGDWSNFIWHGIQQMVIVTAIIHFFAGPIQWIILILSEFLMGAYKHDKAKQKLIINIGKKVFEELDNQLPDIQQKIRDSVDTQFSKFADNITEVLQNQVDTIKVEQEKILSYKRDKKFSIEQEKKRQETINSEVLSRFNIISHLIDGRTYTLEDIQKLAQRKIMLKDGIKQ